MPPSGPRFLRGPPSCRREFGLDGRSYACLRGGSNAALGLRPEWCEESGYDNGFFSGPVVNAAHRAAIPVTPPLTLVHVSSREPLWPARWSSRGLSKGDTCFSSWDQIAGSSQGQQ